MDDTLINREMRSSGTIRIIVGQNGSKKTFHVPAALLTGQSAFFKAALKPGRFLESETKTVRLPTDDPLLFAEALRWLYYYEDSIPNINPSQLDDDALEAELDKLYQLWVLADKLLAPKLQNAIASRIQWFSQPIMGLRAVPTVEVLYYVYENTVDAARLRTLLVDMILIALHTAESRGKPMESIYSDSEWERLPHDLVDSIERRVWEFIGSDETSHILGWLIVEGLSGKRYHVKLF